jgi:HD superfamily phosphohydrolase
LYDLEWIINALQVDPDADRIYVTARGLHAVEEYLQARYYMFRQVYFHRSLAFGRRPCSARRCGAP